jgi:hypothetical protein
VSLSATNSFRPGVVVGSRKEINGALLLSGINTDVSSNLIPEEYLGRYTHKVAISNHRIKSVDEACNVSFEYKDYADAGKNKLLTLSGLEFLRRFEQHILPKGFVKIRSYGYLGNYKRKQRVNDLLKSMKKPQHPAVVKIPIALRMLECYGKDITLCPACKKAKLELLYVRHLRATSREVLKE